MLIVNAYIANAGRHLEQGGVSNHGEVLTAIYKLYPLSVSSEITRCTIYVHSRLVPTFSK